MTAAKAAMLKEVLRSGLRYNASLPDTDVGDIVRKSQWDTLQTV